MVTRLRISVNTDILESDGWSHADILYWRILYAWIKDFKQERKKKREKKAQFSIAICDCHLCTYLLYSLFRFWYSQPPDASQQTLHCWFLHILRFWAICVEWPSPSSLTETTHSNLIWKLFSPKKLQTCQVFCSVLMSSSIPGLPGVCCPFRAVSIF